MLNAWWEYCNENERCFRKYFVEGMRVSEELYNYLLSALDRIESTFRDPEVTSAVAMIIRRSIGEVRTFDVSKFVGFGDLEILEGITKQMLEEHRSGLASHPYMVVLYGPPGTGKTSWCRYIAKKYLVQDGELRGLYLEVSVGDLVSKYVGVPVKIAKAILSLVKTTEIPSILVFDEADAVFQRPESIGGSDALLEQTRLVAELKSELSFITSETFPTLIVLTTNYPDAIARTDPALADRIIAWLEVPPPPPQIVDRIVARRLYLAISPLFGGAPAGVLNRIRALLVGALAILPPALTDRGRYEDTRLYWWNPVLPFDTDFMVGLATVFGINPLHAVRPVSYMEAMRVWNESNPLYDFYAKVLRMVAELIRAHFINTMGVERSLLRIMNVIERGIDDTVKLWSKMYSISIKVNSDLVHAKTKDEEKKILNEVIPKLNLPWDSPRLYSVNQAMTDISWSNTVSHYLQPINPTVLIMNCAKYVPNINFVRVVNDLLSLVAPITWSIRFVLSPLVLKPFTTINDEKYYYAVLSEHMHRFEKYNEMVVEALRESPVFEAYRVMYTEKDLEKAWSDAVKLVDGDDDVSTYLRIGLAFLKVLHPVIHSDPERKAIKLYELARNRASLEATIVDTLKSLGVLEEFVEIFREILPDGIYNTASFKMIVSSSMFADTEYYNRFLDYSPHHPLALLGSRTIEPILYEIAKKYAANRIERKNGVEVES